MKKNGYDDGEATGGTKVASSLMHAAYAGDQHIDDVEQILKPEGGKATKKKKKKSRSDDNGYSSSDDSLTREDLSYGKEVIANQTKCAPQVWNCDLKETDESGWTALHYAASKGHGDTIAKLLRAAGKKRSGNEDLEGSDPTVSSERARL